MVPSQSQPDNTRPMSRKNIAMLRTRPYPAINSTLYSETTTRVASVSATQHPFTTAAQKKMNRPRIVATIIVGILAISFYFIWQPSSPAQTSTSTQASIQTSSYTQPVKTATPSAGSNSSDTGSTIQVYIIGAVQHPGVYTLATNSRVYQLLQAAGGPQTGANLAAINLASLLSDGQEIYLPHTGETPIPAMSGSSNSGSNQAQLVNINSASVDELRQSLQLSSKSAQDIVNYRLQHGPYSSVDVLALVVSKTIYSKIKGKVTI